MKLLPIFHTVFILFFSTTISAEKWETVPNDPLNVKMTTLENGLKVFLSVNKKEPKIQTYISVLAGSKNDPAETTGLAHYFEHLMFKGSQNFGTIDYPKEQLLLERIEQLFEKYRVTKDSQKRQSIYKQIDEISQEASKYAAPNEYDKMLNVIGATGTNAYTSNEETVYVNTIPSNRLDTWLNIEYDRFSTPVIRLFHTELETVYEEKNRSLDSDSRRMFETLLATSFPTHQYGTQTTLGTIEHLKNPSIRNVRNFFNTYYVPNNMAIVLSGDFDPESTLIKIKATFGQLKAKLFPAYDPPQEKPITKPIIREIVGPDAEKVYIAFRFPGAASKEADLLTMTDMVLTNGKAGLIDLNINQQQKVLGAFSSPLMFKDYSLLMLGGAPAEGQTLEEVKNLLLEQVEELKQGNFADWLPEAVVNDLKLRTIRSYEKNTNRANAIVNAFNDGIPWHQAVTQNDRLAKTSKKQIIDFANKNLSDNYVVIYKRKGEAPKLEKIIKPAITPISISESNQSTFCKNILNSTVTPIKPEFIDFDKAISKKEIGPGRTLLYNKNKENDLFSMKVIIDVGTDLFPELDVVSGLFGYTGTKTMSAPQIQQFFYRKGCEFSLTTDRKQTTLSLSGLAGNAEASAKVLAEMINNPQVQEQILKLLTSRILKARANAKTNKETILWKGLLNYAKYGVSNPFRNVLSNEELQALKVDSITSMFKWIANSRARVLFYGPQSQQEAAKLTSALLQPLLANELKQRPKLPEIDFDQKPSDGTIYYVNFPGMKQVQMLLSARGDNFNPMSIAERRLFNEYFGSGMSSLVFQQIREARALAYSTFASYSTPSYPEDHHYFYAFVGTQKDKFFDALDAMTDLITNMPAEEDRFKTVHKAVENKARTSRIHGEGLLGTYEYLRRMNLKDDFRQVLFENLQKNTIKQLVDFHNNKIVPLKRDLLVLGDLDQGQLKKLSEKGKIKELKIDDVFGY